MFTSKGDGMLIFVDYQTLVKEKTPYERAVSIDSAVAICESSDWNPKSMPADMPTMMPESHLGVMAVLSEGGALVPILTASDLLRKLKELWKDKRE
jgi:hypothetical protein